MKRLFFATGIVIILVGALVAVNYSLSVTATEKRTVNSDYNVWEISGDYQAGQKLIVGWRYASAWAQGYDEVPDDQVDVYHKHIWFEVVDPNNGITEFNTAFTSIGPSGERLVGIFLVYINVTIRSAGLNVTAQDTPSGLYELGGTTMLDGTYTARVYKDFEPPLAKQTPPYWLALEREDTITSHPNTSLLPIGISISGAGAIVSVLSMRSGKKKNGKT